MVFTPQGINTANIYAGPVEIYVDNVLLGATLGGVKLELQTEYGEKTADQSPLLEGSFLKKQRGSVKFKLSDLTLTNLKLVFATPAGTAGAGNKTITSTKEIKLVGNGPNDTERTFTIPKGRFVGNTEVEYTFGDQVGFEVEILMESDNTADDGNHYFTVADA